MTSLLRSCPLHEETHALGNSTWVGLRIWDRAQVCLACSQIAAFAARQASKNDDMEKTTLASQLLSLALSKCLLALAR